jgi:hypothetical protein
MMSQRLKVAERLVVLRSVPIAHRVRLDQSEHQIVGQTRSALGSVTVLPGPENSTWSPASRPSARRTSAGIVV